MTTTRTSARKPKSTNHFYLPDPPERNIDEATAFDQLFQHGDSHRLAVHLGNTDTTLVTGYRWVMATRDSYLARACRPDLMIAFDVDPALYRQTNGYIVSDQGKPPDLVLEVASATTGSLDTGYKRTYYASLGIPEYWRFDERGEYYGAKLAGDRLVGGRYTPLPVVLGPGGVWRGFSKVLGMELHWNNERLLWVDPATGQPLPTFEYYRDLADAARTQRKEAEARADAACTRRKEAEAQAADARARADAARARRKEAEAQTDAARTRRKEAEARADAACARRKEAEARAADARARADATRAEALQIRRERLRNSGSGSC